MMIKLSSFFLLLMSFYACEVNENNSSLNSEVEYFQLITDSNNRIVHHSDSMGLLFTLGKHGEIIKHDKVKGNMEMRALTNSPNVESKTEIRYTFEEKSDTSGILTIEVFSKKDHSPSTRKMNLGKFELQYHTTGELQTKAYDLFARATYKYCP